VPLLKQVLEKYPKDVKLVYKNFPIRSHKFARQAAAAALAANRQGKFWEMHDRLFEKYDQLNNTEIRNIARSIGLDMKRLERDMKDREIQSMITRDIEEGGRIGVRGTPTVFVNGKLLQQRSLQGFSAMIDSELKK